MSRASGLACCLLALAPLSSASVCRTGACVMRADELARQMDKTVPPCQDFYQFACGGFINRTVVPGHKSKTGLHRGIFYILYVIYNLSLYFYIPWSSIAGTFELLGDKLIENLKTVFEGAAEPGEPDIYQGRCGGE